MRTRTFCLLACAGLALGACGSLRAGVEPPHATVAGRTLQEYTAEWWQYIYSVPAANSPLFDETGAKASIGQHGPVFFLVGKLTLAGNGGPVTAERTITVTDKTSLFFPMINSGYDNLGVDPPLSLAELRAGAKANADMTTALHASIDGEAIPDLFSHRETFGPFSYNLPAHGLYEKFGFDFPAQTVTPAVSDGYWLFADPLSVGTHDINFGGSVGTTNPFVLDVTYHVNVVSSVPLPPSLWGGLAAVPLLGWAYRRHRHLVVAPDA